MTDGDGPSWPDTSTEAAPDRQLYSRVQITLAAFLGTPLPGFWLMSQNLKALGRNSTAGVALFVGVTLTCANLLLAFVAPEQVPGMFIWFPFLLATYLMVNYWMGSELASHDASGGQRGSWAVALGVGLAGTVLAVVVIFGLVVLVGG